MAWLTGFRKRVAITVDNNAGVTPADAQGTIPKDLPDFWINIDASGNELRVTYADGVTLTTYDIVATGGGAFNRTGKDGRIDIDAMVFPAVTSMVLLWLYYDSTSAQGDGSSAVVISGARTLTIAHGEPQRERYTFSHAPAYSTRTLRTRPKFPAEIRQIYVEFRRSLRHVASSPRVFEEPWYATQQVVDQAGAGDATMTTMTDLRFVTSERDRLSVWVMATIKAGTTDTVRTLNVVLHTVLPYAPTTVNQTLKQAIGFRVDELYLTS